MKIFSEHELTSMAHHDALHGLLAAAALGDDHKLGSIIRGHFVAALQAIEAHQVGDHAPDNADGIHPFQQCAH